MDNVSLKSKLLFSLLRECVPDVKGTFKNSSEMSDVVSTIKIHKLLAESARQPLEKDLAAWKAAIDSWVHRFLVLASTNSPADKCWAGICLLGVTCQECSSERFLASYSEWLDKLLHHIQSEAASHFVKAASCASLSDLFTRLSEFSNVKDGISQAKKIIQPALKLLNEDTSAIVLEEAICLLCTMIDFFPASIKQHYDSVETAVSSKLMSGICSASVSEKLVHVLSLLPKSKGDEDSWSLMMKKVLLSINSLLEDAFQGLEEKVVIIETTRILLPPGEEPPPLFGGSEQGSGFSIRRHKRLLGSTICALMDCCCKMLTNSYPVPVPVTVPGLVALAGRVLMVDGSLSQSSYPSMEQELIYSELPLLHSHSLDILAAVVKGLSSQLLPHAANIARLLTEFLKRCSFLDLRAKAYSVLKILLLSMGVGSAIHLSKVIVDNVITDLTYHKSSDSKLVSAPFLLSGSAIHLSKVIVDNVITDLTYHKSSDSHVEGHSDLSSNSGQKKRKHSHITGSFQKDPASSGVELDMPRNSTEVLLKIAALEALEALLSVGVSMKFDSRRAEVDRLLMTLATKACQRGCSKDPVSADFQLAALRALLASLISPSRLRPSHLGLGLELFRRGIQESGTKLAEYCAHALPVLEVFIHPRALPMSDLQSTIDEYKFENRATHEPESDDEELNENWRANNNDESGIQVPESEQNANQMEKLPQTTFYSSAKELPPVRGTSVIHVSEARAFKSSASHPSDKDEIMVELSGIDKEDVVIECDRDEVMVGSSDFRNANGQRLDSSTPSCDGPLDASESNELEPMNEKIAVNEKNNGMGSETMSTLHEGKASNLERQVSGTEGDGCAKLDNISAAIENMKRSEKLKVGSESDSDDSIPDIVFDDSGSDD